MKNPKIRFYDLRRPMTLIFNKVLENVKVHCVSKNIADIFVCNLRINDQILIIFGKNIFDTTCHQMIIQFFTSPSICFCTTWGKHNQRNITFYPKRYDCLINITRKITFCLHFWHFGWHFIQSSILSTACRKIAWSVCPLCEHRQRDAFSIHWQQYR